MLPVKSRRKFWGEITRIASLSMLLVLAAVTLIIQNKELNRQIRSLPTHLPSIFAPLTINKLTEDTGSGTTTSTQAQEKKATSTQSKPKPQDPTPSVTTGDPRLMISQCEGGTTLGEPGRYILETHTCVPVAAAPKPLLPGSSSTSSTGASCAGTNKDVKITSGQYAYTGGVDESGDYTCSQCVNGTWVAAGKCSVLHADGKPVVTPPADTATGSEGGTRRANCTDKQNDEYVTVGDGATRSDGQKCMDGSWVDPTKYVTPDYVRTNTSVTGNLPDESTPASPLVAGAGAACATTYKTNAGIVSVVIPSGESALGGTATTTENGERTAVKICKDGKFIPCSDANRSDTPAVTNCTTPTVLPTYMTEGHPDQATCVLGSGYQLPAGRAIPGATGTDVCRNGSMVNVPVTTQDVANYLLGTTSGMSATNLANLRNLCLLYGQNCSTDSGLYTFSNTWLAQADPTFAVQVKKQQQTISLYDVATGAKPADSTTIVACKSELGHTCTDAELSTYALEQLKATDPKAYTQAMTAIAEAKKLNERAQILLAFYTNQNDATGQAEARKICEELHGDCNHLDIFAKNQLASLDPTGELLRQANSVVSQAHTTEQLFSVATGTSTPSQTAAVKQECLRQTSLEDRRAGNGCESTTSLGQFALDTLTRIDPLISSQANQIIHQDEYLKQKLAICQRSCTTFTKDCVINTAGNAVCVSLGQPENFDITANIGHRYTAGTNDCGGMGSICCLEKPGQAACTQGTTCQAGKCTYDSEYQRSLATASYIQSELANNSLSSSQINQILSVNGALDARTVSNAAAMTNTLCGASCGSGSACVYSDQTHKYNCVSANDATLRTQYFREIANLPPSNTDTTRGGLDQSCYGTTLFYRGSCDNSYLMCNDSKKCVMSQDATSLLAAKSVSVSTETLNLNLVTLGANTNPLLSDSSLAKAGCTSSYSTFTANNGCWICWDSAIRSVQKAPDSQYCSNSTLAATLPGKACAQAGGYCASDNTALNTGTSKLNADCPSNMICLKYDSNNAANQAAVIPHQNIGESCSNMRGGAICGPGLFCIENKCASAIGAAFSDELQSGVLATTIRTNPLLDKIPLIGFMADHFLAPITAALDPSYYYATTAQAQVAHSLVDNALSKPDLKAILPDNFIFNTLETLHSDAKVKYGLDTLDAINQADGTTMGGTTAYKVLANLSFFTGAWTERYLMPDGFRSRRLTDIPEGLPIDNAFYGYASTWGNSSSTSLEKFLATTNYGMEITFTAADFLTLGTDSIFTKVSTFADKQLVQRAAGMTLRESAELAFEKAAQKGGAAAYTQAIGNIVGDALLRGASTTLSRPKVWGESIEKATGRAMANTLERTGIQAATRSAVGQMTQNIAQFATGFAVSHTSTTYAIKVTAEALTNTVRTLSELPILDRLFANNPTHLAATIFTDSGASAEQVLARNADELYSLAVNAGYKGTQEEFVNHGIERSLQTQAVRALPQTVFTSSVDATNLTRIIADDLPALRSLATLDEVAQARLLSELSTKYNHSPASLKSISNILTFASDTGITLADNEVLPFINTVNRLVVDFPNVGPISRNSLATLATSQGVSEPLTRQLTLALENTRAPYLMQMTRDLNPFGGHFLVQQELVQESELLTRLQLAGLSTNQAAELSANILHNHPTLAQAQPITMTVNPGMHADIQRIASWVDPQNNTLSRVQVTNGHIIPSPGAVLDPEELALITTLNRQYDKFAGISGFTTLRDTQIVADLQTAARLAQAGNDLRLLVNTTTGSGKNSVIIQTIFAEHHLSQGNIVIEAVDSKQMADAIKRNELIADYFGKDNIIQIQKLADGSVHFSNALNETIELDTLLSRLSQLKVGNPGAEAFKITLVTDELGFALDDVISSELGLATANPNLTQFWTDIFNLKPAANIDELGAVVGRWQTSNTTPTAIAALTHDTALGLENGQRLLDVYQASENLPLVEQARRGELRLTTNPVTGTLDPLEPAQRLQIIQSTLDYSTSTLPTDSAARSILTDLTRQNGVSLQSEFDALRRSTLAELQLRFGDTVASDLDHAMRVADAYYDGIYARLDTLAKIPGDDFVADQGLIKLAKDQAVTGQSYSSPMQALALQDEGMRSLGLAASMPLAEITITPTGVVSTAEDLFSRLGAVYATDATDALPAAKFGFTTLQDSLPLHAPQHVATGSDLHATSERLATAIRDKWDHGEIAMVVDMKSGAASGESLEQTTLRNLQSAAASARPPEKIYLALLGGDGTQTLYRVDPAKLTGATNLDDIGEIIARDLTPEELYARSLELTGNKNNHVLAYFQNRTRGTNFKPLNGDPPRSVISEALVTGDINTFIKDETFQSAGRLRGYDASPYSLFLSGTTETLSPDQAVHRALANQTRLTADLTVARLIETMNTTETRQIVGDLRRAFTNNTNFLRELETFDSQISHAGLAYPTTPTTQATLDVLFGEYETATARKLAILRRAELAGADPTMIADLTRRFNLNKPLTYSDFARAIAGTLQPTSETGNLRNLIATLNDLGRDLPAQYSRGGTDTRAVVQIAARNGYQNTNPIQTLAQRTTDTWKNITQSLRTATTRTLTFITSPLRIIPTLSARLTTPNIVLPWTNRTHAINLTQIRASDGASLSEHLNQGNRLILDMPDGSWLIYRENNRYVVDDLQSTQGTHIGSYENLVSLAKSRYLPTTELLQTKPLLIEVTDVNGTSVASADPASTTNNTADQTHTTTRAATVPDQITTQVAQAVDTTSKPFFDLWFKDVPDTIGAMFSGLDNSQFAKSQEAKFNPTTLSLPRGVDLDTHKFSFTTWLLSFIYPKSPWHQINKIISDINDGAITKEQALNDQLPQLNLSQDTKKYLEIGISTTTQLRAPTAPLTRPDTLQARIFNALRPGWEKIRDFYQNPDTENTSRIALQRQAPIQKLNNLTIAGEKVTISNLVERADFQTLIITLKSGDVVTIYKLLGNLTFSRSLPNSGQLGVNHVVNKTSDLTILLPELSEVDSVTYNNTLLDQVAYNGPVNQTTPRTETGLQKLFSRIHMPKIPISIPPQHMLNLQKVAAFFINNYVTTSEDLGLLLADKLALKQETLFNPDTLTFPRGVDLSTGKFNQTEWNRSFVTTNTPWHYVNSAIAGLKIGTLSRDEAAKQIRGLEISDAVKDQIFAALERKYPARAATANATSDNNQRHPYNINSDTQSTLDEWGVNNNILTELTNATDQYTYFDPVARINRMQSTPAIVDQIVASDGKKYTQLVLPAGRDYSPEENAGECGELAYRTCSNTSVQTILAKYSTSKGKLRLLVLVGKSPSHFNGTSSTHVFLGLIPEDLYNEGKIEQAIVYDPALRNISPLIGSGYIVTNDRPRAQKGVVREILNVSELEVNPDGKFSIKRPVDDIIRPEAVLGMSKNSEIVYRLGFVIRNDTLTPYIAIQDADSNIASEYMLTQEGMLIANTTNDLVTPEIERVIMTILEQANKTPLSTSEYKIESESRIQAPTIPTYTPHIDAAETYVNDLLDTYDDPPIITSRYRDFLDRLATLKRQDIDISLSSDESMNPEALEAAIAKAENKASLRPLLTRLRTFIGDTIVRIIKFYQQPDSEKEGILLNYTQPNTSVDILPNYAKQAQAAYTQLLSTLPPLPERTTAALRNTLYLSPLVERVENDATSYYLDSNTYVTIVDSIKQQDGRDTKKYRTASLLSFLSTPEAQIVITSDGKEYTITKNKNRYTVKQGTSTTEVSSTDPRTGLHANPFEPLSISHNATIRLKNSLQDVVYTLDSFGEQVITTRLRLREAILLGDAEKISDALDAYKNRNGYLSSDMMDEIISSARTDINALPQAYRNIRKNDNPKTFLQNVVSHLVITRPALAQMQEKLISSITRDPNQSATELMRQVDEQLVNVKLVESEKTIITSAITNYVQQRKRVRELMRQYRDRPNDFVQDAYGFKPRFGTVKMVETPVGIELEPSNIFIFAHMWVGKLSLNATPHPTITKILNNPSVPGPMRTILKNASDISQYIKQIYTWTTKYVNGVINIGGFAKTETNIPNAKGIVTVLNPATSKFLKKIISPHETRHQITNLFLRSAAIPSTTPELDTTYKDMVERLPGLINQARLGNPKPLKQILLWYAYYGRISAEYNTANEIFSFIAESKNSTISSYRMFYPTHLTLNNESAYGYISSYEKEIRDNITQNLVDYYQKSGVRPLSAVEKLVSEVAHMSGGSKVGDTLIRKGLLAYNQLIAKGYSKEESLAILQTTRLANWPATARKAPRKADIVLNPQTSVTTHNFTSIEYKLAQLTDLSYAKSGAQVEVAIQTNVGELDAVPFISSKNGVTLNELPGDSLFILPGPSEDSIALKAYAISTIETGTLNGQTISIPNRLFIDPDESSAELTLHAGDVLTYGDTTIRFDGNYVVDGVTISRFSTDISANPSTPLQPNAQSTPISSSQPTSVLPTPLEPSLRNHPAIGSTENLRLILHEIKTADGTSLLDYLDKGYTITTTDVSGLHKVPKGTVVQYYKQGNKYIADYGNGDLAHSSVASLASAFPSAAFLQTGDYVLTISLNGQTVLDPIDLVELITHPENAKPTTVDDESTPPEATTTSPAPSPQTTSPTPSQVRQPLLDTLLRVVLNLPPLLSDRVVQTYSKNYFRVHVSFTYTTLREYIRSLSLSQKTNEILEKKVVDYMLRFKSNQLLDPYLTTQDLFTKSRSTLKPELTVNRPFIAGVTTEPEVETLQEIMELPGDQETEVTVMHVPPNEAAAKLIQQQGLMNITGRDTLVLYTGPDSLQKLQNYINKSGQRPIFFRVPKKFLGYSDRQVGGGSLQDGQYDVGIGIYNLVDANQNLQDYYASLTLAAEKELGEKLNDRSLSILPASYIVAEDALDPTPTEFAIELKLNAPSKYIPTKEKDRYLSRYNQSVIEKWNENSQNQVNWAKQFSLLMKSHYSNSPVLIMRSLKQHPIVKRYLQPNVEAHSVSVMDTYRQYVSQQLPHILTEEEMLITLALHDLTKNAPGVMRGEDMAESAKLAKEILESTNIPPRNLEVITTLIAQDHIGKYLQGLVSLEETKANIDQEAHKLGARTDEYLETLLAYYISDASTYTKAIVNQFIVTNPVYQSSLDLVFDVDTRTKTIHFKPKYQEMISALSQQFANLSLSITNPTENQTQPVHEFDLTNFSHDTVATYDEYVAEYGQPPAEIDIVRHHEDLYFFQRQIIDLAKTKKLTKTTLKMAMKNLEKAGVQIHLLKQESMEMQFGKGTMGASTNDTIHGFFNLGSKRVAHLYVLSIEDYAKLYNVSEDEALFILAQKVGHEGGHALDWVELGLGTSQAWATEFRQKAFNMYFYQSIGADAMATAYQHFIVAIQNHSTIYGNHPPTSPSAVGIVYNPEMTLWLGQVVDDLMKWGLSVGQKIITTRQHLLLMNTQGSPGGHKSANTTPFEQLAQILNDEPIDTISLQVDSDTGAFAQSNILPPITSGIVRYHYALQEVRNIFSLYQNAQRVTIIIDSKLRISITREQLSQLEVEIDNANEQILAQIYHDATALMHPLTSSTVHIGDRYIANPTLDKEGGLGKIFRGWDTTLMRPIVIKITNQEKINDEYDEYDTYAGLATEARVSANIQSPSHAMPYDIVDENGTLYYIMDYIAGPNLAEYQQNTQRLGGNLSEDEIFTIARQVALQLDTIHVTATETPIVHRDIKPANIILNPTLGAVVVDYGLTPAAMAALTKGSEARMGTPSYASPDQFAGREASIEEDNRALILTTIELLTGEKVFPGDYSSEVISDVEDNAWNIESLSRQYAYLSGEKYAELAGFLNNAYSLDPSVYTKHPTAIDLINHLQTLLH